MRIKLFSFPSFSSLAWSCHSFGAGIAHASPPTPVRPPSVQGGHVCAGKGEAPAVPPA